MRVVNLIIAVLVALAASGIAFYLASAQTRELEDRVSAMRTELDETKMELARARQELAKADTTKVREQVNELSEALWGRVGDLTKTDAELESRIEELASRPAPASPGFAGPGNREEPLDGEGQPDVEELVQGAGKLFKGFADRMMDRQVQRYAKELNLTEAQSQDVKKILSDQSSKMMESIGKLMQGGEEVDRRAIMEEMMAERDAALQQILTPEQFDKFKEMEQEQMGRWGGMFGGGRRRPGGDGQAPGGEGR